MKLSGDIRIKAAREKVFEALRDPQFFASCIDGIRDLQEVDATRYDAVLETKVAYLRFKFKVTVELTRIDPPREIEAKIEGTPLGVVGRLTAASRTRLSEDPAGTLVEYEIDSALTGKLGGIGQPVLKSKAKQMEQQFFARLRAAFEEAAPAEAP
jgi:uncharacterized protein